MKSLATLTNLSTTLSQNISSANQALFIQLMSDQHRYLIQKYFDNERTFQTTTVGGSSLTTTATMALNAVSATLTATWAYPTVQQLVNFSNGNQRTVLFTNGSAAITWTGGLTSSCTTAISSVGVQKYAIPAVVSKIKNDTITVGQLKYLSSPVQTRNEWDLLNTLPYTSDIVNNFFIYNGFVEFFPIPSTTGNIITFNYKARMPDFSSAFLFSDTSGTAYSAGATTFDYQAGSLSGLSIGSTAVTGASTSWNTTGKFPLNTDVSFYNLYLNINAPYGEGIWYPISQFNSDTSLTLALPIVSAPSTTAASHGYAIGQLPVLDEDFHDMIVYGALMTYFSTIVKDPIKFEQAEKMYNNKLVLLEDYAGTKQVNVDLGGSITPNNPNLFYYSNTSTNLP